MAKGEALSLLNRESRPEILRRWVDALRSGNYTEHLRAGDFTHRSILESFSIYGVLLDVIDKSKWIYIKKYNSYSWEQFCACVPPEIVNRVISYKIMEVLDDMVKTGLRFTDIADLIEENISTFGAKPDE